MERCLGRGGNLLIQEEELEEEEVGDREGEQGEEPWEEEGGFSQME